MIRSGLILLALVMVLGFSAITSAEEEKNENGLKGGIKSTVSGVVSGTVSTGKDVLSGITEGIDEGRKTGDSADGARIISNREELEQFIKVRATKVESLGGDSYRITLALQNDNDFLVRLTKLNEMGSIALLDDEGFSYPLPESRTQGADITALGKSATRARYTFRDVESTPEVLRFLGTDIQLPPLKPAEKTEQQ